MSKIVRFSFVFFFVIATCAIATAQSQATTGQIVGTVKNPNGELVAGATVTITNPATGLKQTVAAAASVT